MHLLFTGRSLFNQSINQWFLGWPKWPKSLQGPLKCYRQKDCCSKNVFKWRLKDCNVGAQTKCSGREFQIWAAATGKARLPTVDSLTGGTTSRLVPAERSARRPGTSAVLSRSTFASVRVAVHILPISCSEYEFTVFWPNFFWLGGTVVRALDLWLEIAGSIPAAAQSSATYGTFTFTFCNTEYNKHQTTAPNTSDTLVINNPKLVKKTQRIQTPKNIYSTTQTNSNCILILIENRTTIQIISVHLKQSQI